MLINPLIGLFNSSSSQALGRTSSNAKLTLADLFSSQRASSGDTTDNSVFSSVAQLQTQLSGLRQANVGISQSLSVAQTADSGAERIADILGKLQNVAAQAAEAGNPAARQGLNEQFQALLKEIDTTAQNTRFGAGGLLDGSLSGSGALSLQSVLGEGTGAEALGTLSIGAVSSATLLGDAPINVLSADGANDALARLQGASEAVATLRADIGAFQSDLEFAGATLVSAMFNQNAAQAVLGAGDLVMGAAPGAQALVQQNMNQAVAAQIVRLPPSMLEMLSY